MIKPSMYQKVNKLKEIGYTLASIVSTTGLDIKTVKKYLNMTSEEYLAYYSNLKQRTKLFDPYLDEVLEIIRNANTSKIQASAIYDHLEERHGELPGSERTFRSYVAHLRENGDIIQQPARVYEPVEPLPLGYQMQLDFGEYRCKNNRKYYILAAILSNSRCRYVKIYERSLTTEELIKCLCDCFEYYGGIPKQIVIDQDHLMVVDENKGDVILTKAFQSFLEEMAFELYVCRKSDPESKGKVENLVNFVKRSFFATRNFSNLEEASSRLSKWLIRKANGKKCAATGRKPIEHLEEERKHLSPIRNSIFAITDKNRRELRKVDKLGQISVKGVRLSLPAEYSRQTVSVFIGQNEVHVFDLKTDEKIAVFTLKTGLSKTPIIRQKSLRLQKYSALKDKLIARYRFKEWQQLVEKNYQKYKRYFVDQYNDFIRKFKLVDSESLFEEAVKYCLKNNTVSVTQLFDTYSYLSQGNSLQSEMPQRKYKLLTNDRYQVPQVAKRNIGAYSSLVKEMSERSL